MQPPLSAEAIRDTAAAVFEAPEFRRTMAGSLLDRLLVQLAELFAALRAATSATPVLYRLFVGAAALLVLAVATRLAWHWWARRGSGAPRPRPGRHGAGGDAGDPWSLAQSRAGAGDFTAAAHLLYAAVLTALVRRGAVRLHPAKTIGDYARELRGRAAGALLAPYREFARVYELVVYGTGSCDRERYERLRALAAPLVMGDG